MNVPRLIVLMMLPLPAFGQLGGESPELFGRPGGMSSLPGMADAQASPSPEAKKKDAAPQQKPPTVITATKEATYDEKTRQAVFTGDVRVDDPEIKITSDKLTAFLRKEAAGGAGASPAPKPTAAAAKPGASPAAGGRGSGLERAIAEGHVIIVQDKPAADGGEPQHNVGKAEKADYNANTGDILLTGMPEVSQGINTQIATSPETTMTMNRDGRTMKTRGPSKTVIQDTSSQPDSKSSPRP